MPNAPRVPSSSLGQGPLNEFGQMITFWEHQMYLLSFGLPDQSLVHLNFKKINRIIVYINLVSNQLLAEYNLYNVAVDVERCSRACSMLRNARTVFH